MEIGKSDYLADGGRPVHTLGRVGQSTPAVGKSGVGQRIKVETGKINNLAGGGRPGTYSRAGGSKYPPLWAKAEHRKSNNLPQAHLRETRVGQCQQIVPVRESTRCGVASAQCAYTRDGTGDLQIFSLTLYQLS